MNEHDAFYLYLFGFISELLFFCILADYSINRIHVKINLEDSKKISKTGMSTYSVLVDYFKSKYWSFDYNLNK